jgi:hypothetical protein
MIIYFYINFIFIKNFIILIISNIIMRLRLLRRVFFVRFTSQTISTICVLTAPFASDYLDWMINNFVTLSIIIFMNHFELMTEIMKLHNINNIYS